MEQQFIIHHQDGNITRKVNAACVLFKQEGGVWKIGLEVETEETDEDGWPQLHLMDFPVGAEDPRPRSQLEVRVPRGFDGQTRYTNLYFFDHGETNHNVIKLSKLPGDEYLLEWVCTGEDVNYYDERAQGNRITVRCKARVVDDIVYPW